MQNANKNEPLKRYEAAILLTKLLGAEEEVQGNAFVSSTYADATEIPGATETPDSTENTGDPGKDPTAPSSADSGKKAKKTNVVRIVIIVVLVLGAGAAGVVFVVLKKKKATK